MSAEMEPQGRGAEPGMVRPAVVLIIVAAVASALLAFVYSVTRPAIEEHQAERIIGIQKRVLPGADEYLEKGSEDALYYEAKRGSTLIGRILRVLPAGYGGPIDMFVGIAAGEVTGVEVLAMKETPGFGDKVAVPGFLKQFRGKSAQDPVAIGDGIDAVTGATITSRAITKGVREALDNEKKLLSVPAEGGSK